MLEGFIATLSLVLQVDFRGKLHFFLILECIVVMNILRIVACRLFIALAVK